MLAFLQGQRRALAVVDVDGKPDDDAGAATSIDLGDAADGNGAANLLQQIGRHVRENQGFRGARGHAVDAHVARADFQRHGSGEGDDRAFARERERDAAANAGAAARDNRNLILQFHAEPTPAGGKYSIFVIINRRIPAGNCTLTSSSSRLPNRARASGASMLM